MAQSVTKTVMAQSFAAIYGKGLNFIKTDSATDPGTIIYRKDLKLYKKQTMSQPAAKNRLCHTLHHWDF